MANVIDINSVRKGNKLEIEGDPYLVVGVEFRKPGKGTPTTAVRMKHMMTGSVISRTYQSGERLELADIEEREMQYLYAEGDMIVLMDNVTYDQISVPAATLDEQRGFLVDNSNVSVVLYKGRAVGIELPTFVDLQVTATEPGFKGDTSNNVLKPATLSTGGVVNVPIFINEGDVVRVDTRTLEYVERVAKR